MSVMPSRYILAAFIVALAAPVHAELPDGARSMIDAAIATGDAAKVATAIELARKAFPDDQEAIDAIAEHWTVTLAERTKAQEEKKEQAIRQAGLFDRWSGKGELGGFQSTGNTTSVGVSASLSLKRTGINWSHALRARADYQRQNGTISRQQFLFSYEPRWQFGRKTFAYGLAQYDSDRIQGIAARYSVSGGIGYQLVDTDAAKLSLKAGPAYRITNYSDVPTEHALGGLIAADFEWRVFDRLKLTQTGNAVAETGGQATAFVGGRNTSLDLLTGLEFKISDRLVSRLSYQLDYNSNPPPGAVATDTLTRMTLVYGF